MVLRASIVSTIIKPFIAPFVSSVKNLQVKCVVGLFVEFLFFWQRIHYHKFLITFIVTTMRRLPFEFGPGQTPVSQLELTV